MNRLAPLHIGVLGPVSLQRLKPRVDGYEPATEGLGSPIVTDLIESVHHRGHRLSVFTLSPDARDWGDADGENLALHVRRFRPRGRARSAFRAEISALVDAVRSDPPEVLHAHWTYEFALAALRTRIPSVVTVRDWAPGVLRRHRHPYRVVRLGMQAAVLARTPHLTAVSPYIAGRVHRWYRKEVPVIPNGVAVPERLPSRSGGGPLVLGSVNNGFGVLKNVGVLIEAFGQILHEHPGAGLRLAGRGFEVGGPAHEWAKRNRLDSGIEWVGYIDSREVPAFMRSLDVLVHPSLEESFGLTLIEGMAEGTLVVGGANSGAVPWVLGHGSAGTLVDVRSPEAISRAVNLIVHERERWPELRDAGWEHVKENFSLDAVVDGYLQAYRQALGETSGDPPRGWG